MKLRLPHALIKALGCVFGVAVTTLGTSNSYGAGMHSQVSLVTYTDFGQNMGRYRVNGVNDLLSSIRTEEGGVVITYLEGHEDYTLEHYMPSFESQVDSGAFAAVGYNFIATVQHNNCQNPTFTGRYLDGNVSLHYYGVEYRDAFTFCLVAQSDDQKHTQDYKLTRMNRLITDVTPSTPATLTREEILALPGTMEYRSGSGRMFLWSLDGTSTLLRAAYDYAIGGMRRIDTVYLNNENWLSFFTTTTTMDYSAQGVSESDPLPFAPASGDSGSPVWIWDEDSQSYVYLNAYQSISNGGLTANARGDLDYTWKVLDKFAKEVGVSGGTVHIKGVVATDGDTEISETTAEHVYTTRLHHGSVVDAQGNTLQQFVGVKGDDDKYIHTWLNLAPEKDNANWFAYDNKYYNVGVYNNIQRELEIQNLFFTENLVFLASSASGNTVAVDADTDLGVGYVQFSIAPESGLDHADFTLQSNGRTSGGKDGAQRDFMLNSAGFVVDKGVDLHVKLTNTEWDSAANDYYYREWRKVGDGNLHLEGSGNNEIFLNVGGKGTTYLNEQGGYAAYNVYAGSGATVAMDSTAQVARDFTFGYNGGTLDIRGNNSMDWYRTNTNVAVQGFSINSFSEDSYITNSLAGTTLNLTYRERGSTEYIGSFVDTEEGGAVRITFDAGSGSTATLHGIHTSLTNADSGITVSSGKVVLSGINTVHGMGSATGRNADRYFSADDWHYADMATKLQVDGGAVFELGSHARLTGDVTVNEGGRLVVREGVHSTYEHIEGGLCLEDATTAFYRRFYGLHGNVTAAAGSTVEFAYSSGTSAEQVYTGNITGGADVYMDLGGSGATLRLSGTNTFSGTKSLSGGGLISDNGLAALGSVLYDTLAWHVAEDAFIAANNATGAQLLPLVKKDSTGVLALTQAQAADLNLQNMGYSGLIVGALKGMDVHYGTAGASLSTVQNGGKDRWLLGGGGGNLIVDFALRNSTAELVLGNEYTTGNVTLTNSSNEIGTISFMGQVTLSYTDEAALGGATVDLNYTNRMQLLSSSGMGGISSTSAGVVLVDKLGGAALDMTEHPGLYIGASTAKQLDAAPLIAPGAAYRFGGIDGTLTVNAVLANAGSQPTGLFVDGQTFSGGVLELAQAATITGAVDVRGYDPDRMLPSMAQKGDITLRLTAENAIASASSVTMEDGGIIDIYGSTQALNNLSAEAGSLVTDSSLSGSGVLNLNNTTGTTFGGVLDVARVNKTGTGTLNLSGTSLVDAYNVQQGTLNVSAPAAISGVAYIQGGATLSLAAGDYGMVAALQDGANLRVADNATATLGGLVLADNATMTLLSGGTLKVTDMETIIGNGATLNLTGASLALAIDEDLHFTTTLRASGGASSTVTVSGGNKDTSYTREFDSISVDAGSTLTLEQSHQETSPTYFIHNLAGAGNLVLNACNYKAAPAHYIFDRDTDFAGTVTFQAHEAHSGHKYMFLMAIQSDNALSGAQVEIGGLTSDNGVATLGIDTDNAAVQGLATMAGSGNRAILMAGSIDGDAVNEPRSSRRATLTITGSETKNFQGKVVGGADGTDHGLSIVMNGSGTQTFSGVSVFNDVSALKGTLEITNNTAIKGDLAVARGATLEINKTYTLGSGKTLHVVGDSSAGTATLTAPLTISGGTIDFSGDALSTSSAALTLSSAITGSATISFSETSLLQTGVTYKLVDGNWSNITLTTASLDYLTARVSATSTGLTATFSLRDDSYIWNGNSAQHTWTTSTFGQQTLSFQSTYRAVFTDAAESKDVQVNASISAASLIIDSTGEYTFGGSGKVTASTLSQLASGTTNIGSSVKITGQAHVQAGTLAMHSGASTGSVLVDEGATLVLKDAEAATGFVSGGGALVIDWDGQSGSIPAIGESGIGSLRVASGTLTTAAQLNVKNGTWVEQGATLRATVGGILSSGQALHLAGNLELNLAAAGSLTTSIAGYDDAKGSIAKTGNGALTVAAGISADSFTVSGGSVVVNMDASLDLNTLAIGSDRSVLVHRDGNSVRNIGSVQLGASSTLSLYSDTAPSTAMAMDSLVLQGDSATVKAENHAGALAFRSLSHSGTGTATLNLVNAATSYNVSIFELGGHDENPGDFTGDIVLTSTNNGPSRSAAVVLDDANVAAGAVVRLQSAASEGAILALGVNAEVVNIAGLASNSALGARTRVISGTIAPSRDSRQEAAFAGSEETHKLVITTASGSAYDFYGTIGRNVDLTVAGSGTQRLLGSGAAFSGMLTVQGGTLQIANAADFGSSSEKEGFNATLAGGTLALQGGGLNLGSGCLSVTGDTTISMDTAGEYTYRDGSDSENGFSLMTVVSAAAASHTAGSLTGQGVLAGKELIVMDNGVYALDSAHGRAYYVNTTVDYGPQASGSAYANADSLVLNHDGAVLNMQAGLSSAAQAKGITAAVAGGTVNLGGGVTLQASSLTANAATTLAGAGTYALANANGMPENVQLSGNAWYGTVRFTGASNALDLAGTWVGSGAAASTVEFCDWSGSFAGNSETIGAKVQLAGSTAMTLSSAAETTVAFTNTVGGSADIAHSGAGKLNLSFTGGNLAWNGSFVNADGTADITYSNIASVANSISSMDGAVNVLLSNVGAYNGDISNASLHVSGTTAFNGSGYLTSLDIAQNADFSIGGSTNVMGNVGAGGSLAVAAGANLTLHGNITALAGKIANDGTLNFGGHGAAISLTGDAAAFGITAEGYTSIAGEEGDNGFHHTMTGDITSGSGSVAGGGSVAITFNGATVTGLNADGSFGTVDNTTYYVRSGAVNYSDIASTSAITAIRLAGGTLNLNAPLAASVTSGIQSQGGSVNIGSGITLQAASLAASAATSLAGSGSYVLATSGADFKGLDTNLTLSSDWTGSVVLSGPADSTVKAINLQNSAPGTAGAVSTSLSTIELHGIQGWLKHSGTSLNDANLILTNPAEGGSALKLDNGTTNATTYLTGSISGSGDLEHAWAKSTPYFEMTGDLSRWTGNIIKSSKETVAFTLKNNPGGTVAVGALAKNGQLNITVDNSNPVTLSGNFRQDGGTLNMTVAAGTDASFTGNVTGVSSLTLAAGAAAAFSGANSLTNVTMADGASLRIAGGSTSISGSSSLKSIAVQQGGALAFASGSTTALYGPISLAEQIANGGTLDFGGRSVAVDLGGDAAASAFAITAEGYTDIHDNEGDNGFHHTLGGTVIANSGFGSIAGAGSVIVSYAGTGYALRGDGSFGREYDDRSRYHVRSGSVDYTDLAGVSGITTIAVSGNGTLNLNTALAANVGIAAAGGAVNIGSGVTLQASSLTEGAATTLTGTGTYALPSGQTSLNNVTIGGGWKGVVRLSGTAQDWDISTIGNNIASTIEFAGVTGYFGKHEAQIQSLARDVIFTNAGDNNAAVYLNNGYSRDGAYEFSGSVSGSGTFQYAGSPTYHVVFSGDVSGWDGLFKVTNCGSGNDGSWVKFTGDAHEVNAAIDKTRGTFRVIADTDVTFNGSVSSDLEISQGHTATLTATATLTSLKGAGNLVVDSGSKTVTIGGGGNATGTITVDSGTLNLGGSQHTGITSLTINGGGKVVTTGSNGNGLVGGTVTINAGGVLEATDGAHDIFGYKNDTATNNYTDKVVMNGTAGKEARIDLKYTAADSVTMSTNLEMNGHSAISGKAINSFGGNISASGAGNTISAFELREAVTIDVAQGGSLEIGSLSRFYGFGGAIAKTGDGTLTLKGGVIDKAIAQSGGTLALDGNFTVDGLATVGDPIVYYAGAEDFTHRNNGVRGSWLDLQLRTANSTGSLSITDASRFTYGGQTMTGTAGEAGVLILKSEGFTSTFYINEDSERTAWIFRAGADYPATDVSIARGATLVVDDNAAAGFSASKIKVQEGTGYANLRIEDGNTVVADSADRALQLSGSGSYKLNGTLGLGSLATAADGSWAGVIDSKAVDNWEKIFNLYTSANIHGGTVLLKSVTGDSTTDEHALELQLGGHNKTEGSYTFAQATFKAEGDGNLRISDYSNAHTWIVGTGTSFDVSGDIRMDQKQTLSIQGGTVQTGGRMVLGHSQSGTAPSGLSMTSGSLTTDGIVVIANSTDDSLVSITGGTVEFTSAAVLQLGGNSAATVTLGGTGDNFVTLKAGSTSWTLAHDGMDIGNISAVTTGGNTITLGAEGMSANFNGKVQVAEGSRLAINGAATIQQTIQNAGTFTIGANLATTELALHEQQEVNVQLDGTVTLASDANYFTGAKADFIVLAEGPGSVAPNNHTLAKGGKEYTIQANGLAVGNISCNYTNFYQHEEGSTLNASAIAEKAGFMFSVDVQNATLNVDAAIATTTASNARLLVQDPDNFLFGCVIAGGTNEIVLQGGKTLDLPNIQFDAGAGEKVLQLMHADGSAYQVTDNTNARVRISSLKEDTLRRGRVTITAAAGAPGSFDIGAASFNVDASRLEKVAGGTVTVNNTLSVQEVRNAEPGMSGGFILTGNVDAHALKSVIATAGNIEFRSMNSTERANLANLEIGAGKTVGFYSDGIADVAHEVSVSVVGTLTAGASAALNANLVMEEGSTLDVRGTGGAGLLMGSEVTLSKGMTLSDYSGEWASWEVGTKYVLFTGVDGFDTGNGVTTGTMDYTQWVDAKEYFDNIQESNRYFLCYGGAPDQDAVGVLTTVNNGSNVGMVYIMTMPEPATGTLSLLALAALAVRRRRK